MHRAGAVGAFIHLGVQPLQSSVAFANRAQTHLKLAKIVGKFSLVEAEADCSCAIERGAAPNLIAKCACRRRQYQGLLSASCCQIRAGSSNGCHHRFLWLSFLVSAVHSSADLKRVIELEPGNKPAAQLVGVRLIDHGSGAVERTGRPSIPC